MYSARLSTTVPLLLTTALGLLATDLYLPAIPTITEALETSVEHAQYTLVAFFAAFSAFQLVLAHYATQRPSMTYVVTDERIKCKYTDSVEVCPVDCFYKGENMFIIHPDESIDCGVYEPECTAEAILPDTDQGAHAWLQLNRDYSDKRPNITRKGESWGGRREV